MKVDVCMWAKNGEKFLPKVLKRIDDVIGGDINQKIFVDDSSVDGSIEIAESFGWKVYPNREGWISGGTKEALRHVETEFFVSVEQDVLLAKNWWETVQKYVEDERVAVAQGVYLSTTATIRAYETHHIQKKVNELPFEERSRFCFGIGNNLYRTKIVKELGFVDDPVTMGSFYERIVNNGYKWITDTALISDNLHISLFDDINHNTRFYAMTEMDTFLDHISIIRLLVSPVFATKLIRSGNAFVFLSAFLLRMSLIPAYIYRRQER